jgi:dipeptidyl-peptidase-3
MHTIRFVATVIHELLGHGTGKLLSETTASHFNFNAQNPPTNPLTNMKVTSWYRLGETYSSVFEDIAQSVEECRAILMSAYLVDNKELLRIFGYDEATKLSADELVYFSYLHLGVEGVRSLEHYNPEERS